MLGVFRREEQLKLLRGFLTNGENWWLSKLSRKSKIPVSNLKNIIDRYFAGSLKKVEGRKKKYLLLSKSRLGELEKKCYNRANALREAIELRKGGYSYWEIEERILNIFNVHLDSSVLSGYLRNIELSHEGKKRLKEKIRKDRSKAGKRGIERQRELGILGNHLWNGTLAAIEINTKKLPESSKELTSDKVNVIAHCLFDGYVCNAGEYMTLGYTSMQKKQVQDFMKSVYKVYGFSAYIENKGDLYLCRFSSKNAVKDLMQYSQSYSTKAESDVGIPIEIMKGPTEFKQVFLRAFWDDEGAAIHSVISDKRGNTHASRQLEAYCENGNILKQLLQIHEDLGVPAMISRKRIIISRRDGLENFQEKIGFSDYVVVNAKRSIWYKIQKKVLVEYMLKTYDIKPVVFVKTYGCSSNLADTERILWFIKKMGANIAPDEEDAEIVILNSCGVKQPTEDKIIRHSKDLSEKKKVIMAGCLPKMIDGLKMKASASGLFDNTSIPSVVGVIMQCFLSEYDNAPIVSNSESLRKASHIYANKLIAPIQISTGCLNNCYYCSVKLARGELKSYAPEDLLDEIRESVKNGAKEVWLTSQDNGCYGFDIGTNLAELLRAIVEIPGEFHVRVGMMNPSHMRRFLDDLIDVYQNDKIYKFLHIPVQSGSDKVLKEMNRGYTTKDFESIVSKFRDNMDITISTDIIAGFPTETGGDFQETIELLKRAQPDFLNLSKYWPRKKTVAGEMKQLPREIVAARSKEAADLFTKLLKEKNKSWIGKECSVTFTEEKGDYFVGRNSLYRPVLVTGTDLVGKTCSVTITDSKKSELIGKIL